jgi:transcriptional regulator with XRE-family HTH domain
VPIQYKASSSTFGKRLRQARLAKAIPQDRLGVLAGLDEGTASARISRYESGTHAPPASFAERLATELDVPAAYFYARDDALAQAILVFAKLSPAQHKRLGVYLQRLQRE